MATFAERLRSLRDQKGLTQDGLASALGVSRSTIGGYEAPSKEREPDFAIVCRLAAFFGVSTDYLLGLSDDPSPAATPKEAPQSRPVGAKARRLYDVMSRAEDLPDENVAQIADTLEALINYHRQKQVRRGEHKDNTR